jgi:hypothetical protein
MMILCAALSSAQDQPPNSVEPTRNNQINVNWFYGSYVQVPLEPLERDERLKLYTSLSIVRCGWPDQLVCERELKFCCPF